MIVICCRCVEDQIPVGTWRADLGERPRTRTVRRPEALVWILRGSPADLARAHAWCVAEGGGWRAHPVPGAHESDPLAWARAAAERAGPLGPAGVSAHASLV
jgi:hypothetical protein